MVEAVYVVGRHLVGWPYSRHPSGTVEATMTGDRYHGIITSVIIPTVNQLNISRWQCHPTLDCEREASFNLTKARKTTLPWPLRSPDLSPIEHAWDELGRRIRNRLGRIIPKTDRMERSNEIDQASLDCLCDSMPKKLEACIRSRCGHIHMVL